MKQRIRYFDLLRVLSFACIIYYHIVAELHLAGYLGADIAAALCSNKNMHIATLAVAIFFMLSGAALMISTLSGKASLAESGAAAAQKAAGFDTVRFYKRRFIRLLIPYYIANILYILLYLAAHRGTISGLFGENIPKWRVIFTFLGLDQWILMHGHGAYSTGIGEWFLGALLILYLLFPLLRYLVLKAPGLTLAAATAIYVVLAAWNPFTVVSYMNLIFKGYEFLLGMYLGIYWKKLPKACLCISLPVMLCFFLLPAALPLGDPGRITILALACFVTFSFTEKILEHSSTFFIKLISILSGLPYEIFLVHHLVIIKVLEYYPPGWNGPAATVRTIVLQLAMMTAAGLAVKYISSGIVAAVEKYTCIFGRKDL